MAVRGCGAPCCLVEASAPSPLCCGLDVGSSALDIFAGIADNVLSVGAPRLKPHPLGLASPRGLLVLLLLVGLEPWRPVLQIRGEGGLGAIDEEEWGKAYGSAWGRPQAPDNRG